MLSADVPLPHSDFASGQQSSQQSSQQSNQPMLPPPQQAKSDVQSQHCLRNISFPPLPLQHMVSDQSASNHPGRTWCEATVMTPRQLAVEQLLSHKLSGLPSQQAVVIRPQSVDTIGAVSPKSPDPCPSAGQDADPSSIPHGDHSVATSEGLQVSRHA